VGDAFQGSRYLELTGQLSKQHQQIQNLLNGVKAQVTSYPTRVAPDSGNRRAVRLSRQRQSELVERYRAGALQRELAEAYGVNRKTVSAVLRRHGALRRTTLDDSQVDEIVQRYLAGESLATIGKALNVDHATVRNYLVRRDVPRRDTHGRNKAP
jgi:DNA-binding NarL/FixJ family response regulator